MMRPIGPSATIHSVVAPGGTSFLERLSSPSLLDGSGDFFGREALNVRADQPGCESRGDDERVHAPIVDGSAQVSQPHNRAGSATVTPLSISLGAHSVGIQGRVRRRLAIMRSTSFFERRRPRTTTAAIRRVLTISATGSASNSTRSARLPAATEPCVSSRPSSLAGLIVAA
jgi:hypothetical protein